MADMLRRLTDRAEIQDTLLRYASAVDRGDWERARSCFHPDALVDHAEFHGTPEGFIKWLEARHVRLAKTTHFLGNCLIGFESDDSAAVETCFVAILQARPSEGTRQGAHESTQPGNDQQLVVGRFIERFERRLEAWRVARRQVVFEARLSQVAHRFPGRGWNGPPSDGEKSPHKGEHRLE
jgi:3-phenylpropionate/cinnamic acid dioxygenase small subunit